MKNNHEEFMNICVNLEKHLKRKYKLENNLTLGQALNKTKRQNKIIEYYWDDLNLFRDLRNMLAHERYHNSIVANPSDEIIQSIKKIFNKIKNPSKVGKLFSCEVICFQENDYLESLLKIIKEKDYSQFPIFDKNGLSGLITENAIARWVSRKVDEDIISIKETKLEDVLPMEEVKDNYRLVLPNLTVYDVLDIFRRSYNDNNKQLVLLISANSNPKSHSDIQGIITYADYQKLNNEM